MVILVDLAILYGRPLNPPCWQIVRSIKLEMYACSYITFVIMRHIHIDFFYFLTHFTIEIMNLAILRHLGTTHVRPSPPHLPCQHSWCFQSFFEGEFITKSGTISFFFIFFTIFTHFHVIGHIAPFCHPLWMTPQPLTISLDMVDPFRHFWKRICV